MIERRKGNLRILSTREDIETTLMKIQREIQKLPDDSRQRKIFEQAWISAMKGR